MFKKNIVLWIVTWAAIVVLAGLLFWQNVKTQKTESADLKQLNEQVQAQQSDMQQLAQVLQGYNEQFQQIADHSNQMLVGLKELDKAVMGDKQIWKLMQVQNYLETAILQASLLHDNVSATALLQAAELTLQKLDNPNLVNVRKSLQEDIQMLQKQPGANIENVVLGLNLIVQEVPSLPHKIRLKKETPEEKPAETPKAKTWKQRFENAWNEIKSLIRIQKHDEPVKPYFSNDEVELINENLQLMLEQASFAAVRRNQTLFAQHINMARKWLNQYYDQSNTDVEQVMETLDQLSKLSIKAENNIQLKTIDAWSAFVLNMNKVPAPTPEKTDDEPTNEEQSS